MWCAFHMLECNLWTYPVSSAHEIVWCLSAQRASAIKALERAGGRLMETNACSTLKSYHISKRACEIHPAWNKFWINLGVGQPYLLFFAPAIKLDKSVHSPATEACWSARRLDSAPDGQKVEWSSLCTRIPSSPQWRAELEFDFHWYIRLHKMQSVRQESLQAAFSSLAADLRELCHRVYIFSQAHSICIGWNEFARL